ncbi:hypothetical protein PAL_GLEAN10011886 [Pteropus alecto]|uniref:Uncharacterized protein n=1 Tax=Pteropus alecto TaxID=9402 RepID=L5KHB2_PTEAL|nr:hypothetical protein PAL_GLEAN10011886 [Pteropus alecto]
MKLHGKCMLFLLWAQNTGSRPRGHLAKEGVQKYQLPVPLVHPLGKQETSSTKSTLGLTLLNCQMEPCLRATDLPLPSRVEGTEGEQDYKLAAENQELGSWMWVLVVLLLSLEAQNWRCTKQLAKSPASLPPPPGL